MEPTEEQQSTSSGGVTGLGRMPSMDPACTPLKHNYDQCFNLWFEEYLGVEKTSAHPQQQPTLHNAPNPSAAQPNLTPAPTPEQGKRSWFKPWSRSPSATTHPESSQDVVPPTATDAVAQRARQTSYAHLPSDPVAAQAKRAALKAKFDDCNELFASYQTCVRKAVQERNLEPLIQEARVYNPFPFPTQSGSNPPPENER